METETKECNSPECNEYPYYGVAPHECYWRKPGGFNNPLGTSTILDFDNWPNNFLAEITDDKPIDKQINWGLCGIYYCPECKKDMKPTKTLWSKEEIMDALKATQ